MARLSEATKTDVQGETHRLLLEAALHEFAAKGYAGANVNRISLAAGFAKGTIYNYFPSKRLLMLELIDQIGLEHTSYITEWMGEAKEPASQLRRFFQAGYQFVADFPEKVHVAIGAIFGHDPEFRERVFQAYLGLFTMITGEIIDSGVAQGQFKLADRDIATALLMSLYLGSCSLRDETGNVWLQADQVASFALMGLQYANGKDQPKSESNREEDSPD